MVMIYGLQKIKAREWPLNIGYFKIVVTIFEDTFSFENPAKNVSPRKNNKSREIPLQRWA